jgi:hypothetical protein
MITYTPNREDALEFPFDDHKLTVENVLSEVDGDKMKKLGRPIKFEEFAEAIHTGINTGFVVRVTLPGEVLYVKSIS